jgi:hypothetical protein
MSAEGAQKLFGNLQRHAEHSVKKMMADIPALELPGDLKNFNHQEAFEGVKKAFEEGGIMSSLATGDVA